MTSNTTGSHQEPGASPKSPRLFYTDPLAAAWMAKHHGFKFEDLDYSGNDHWFEMYFAEKLYIHPDSLHLLEPKVGDVAQSRNNEINYFKFLHESELSYPINRIIQRNGIAFHWPESEAA